MQRLLFAEGGPTLAKYNETAQIVYYWSTKDQIMLKHTLSSERHSRVPVPA